MKQKILLISVLLLLLVSVVSALTTIEVSETDLVNLKPEAEDADADTLTYTFSEPLDNNGQWQTDHGDAGEYTIVVTVSDGDASSSQEVLLIVKKKQIGPSVTSFFPKKQQVSLDERKEVTFSVVAEDKNNDPLRYSWKLDSEVVGSGSEYVFTTDFESAGHYNLNVVVSDGESEATHSWEIVVNDINVQTLVDNIHDITVQEGKTVSLDIPDFEALGLRHSISSPLGIENSWKTGYDDAGPYTVTVDVFDGDEKVTSKEVKITVENVDREPVFKPIKNVWMDETQKVTITLEGSDPDTDEVVFSAENLPEGSSLNGNVFTWVTDYDTVQKEGFWTGILDKFHFLYKTYKIDFFAGDDTNLVKQSVKIRVKDVNRAPTITMDSITVQEGELLNLTDIAADPDNDKLKVKFSGYTNKALKKVGFDDQGEQLITVKASDWGHEIVENVMVTVVNTNRMPVLRAVRNREIAEGESLTLPLAAFDPDGDDVTITAGFLPGNATLENGTLRFMPGYDVAENESDVVVYVMRLEASDGSLKDNTTFNISVVHANRAPLVLGVKPFSDFKIAQGVPVLFGVKADDYDGDSLSYEWKFSLFEQYDAGNEFYRTFSTVGSKEVTVLIGDGKEALSHTWQIEVVAGLEAAEPVEDVQKEVAVKKLVKPVVQQAVLSPITTVVQQPVQTSTVQQTIKQVVVAQPTTVKKVYKQYSIPTSDVVIRTVPAPEQSETFVIEDVPEYQSFTVEG